MKTPWTDKVIHEHPLNEYPRPQLRRKEWLNLNGYWNYTITELNGAIPSNFPDRILVPFCIESFLSGVGKALLPNQRLWYMRKFTIPEKWQQSEILLHFGAVDWEASVYLNGKKLGEHQGGYLPFSFNISSFLQQGENTLIVAVRDPTNTENHQRGKQTLMPKKIFYTPCSGIWQTVWIEPVAKHSIKSLQFSPNLDLKTLTIEFESFSSPNLLQTPKLEISSLNSDLHFKGEAHNSKITLILPKVTPWSPKNPFLYSLHFILSEDDEIIDEFDTYCAFRKITVECDESGIPRLFLNNKPLFQMGILDQGYWPDGIYTAPTDEALMYDLQVVKDCGFNMIRKHIKVEPARWYYHCDRLGLIVWQDMISGGNSNMNFKEFMQIAWKGYISSPDNTPEYYQHTRRTSQTIRSEFEHELKQMVVHLSHFPSICVWVPFNEAWGQYDSDRIAEWLMKFDPTRIVDPVSGWNLQSPGQIRSWHLYIRKLRMIEPRSKFSESALVISEYGGYTLKIPQHAWQEKKRIFGYGKTKSIEKLTAKYIELLEQQAKPLISQGLSGLIYTQVTDVENELNGLLTYDRQVKKVNVQNMRVENESFVEIFEK